MKIAPLSRSSDVYIPSRKGDPPLTVRNLNPEMHPFERAREYQRAVRFTKMDKMMAKPFLGQLGDGHVDSVYSLAKDMSDLHLIASGSADGVVKLWDLSNRSEVFATDENSRHTATVKGLTFVQDQFQNSNEHKLSLLSCSIDRTIKLWRWSNDEDSSMRLAKTYISSFGQNSVSAHCSKSIFATAGSEVIQIWDLERSTPIQSMGMGSATLNCVRFNQAERSILATTGGDRGIVIYDLRTSSPLIKLTTSLRNNTLSWNPMEPFNFVTANEDHNLYMFDMRKLDRALNVLKDHVGPVMDCDFAPDGQTLVSGSYDSTIRLWSLRHGRSKDAYHTKRMQRVFGVLYSMDSRYIISASDDSNIRLWRADASSRAHPLLRAEKTKLDYANKVKEKYQHMDEIRRIRKSNHLPKSIKKQSQTKREQEASIKRKEANRRRHSRPGAVPFVPERDRPVVGLEK